jgi:transposase-like protein
MNCPYCKSECNLFNKVRVVKEDNEIPTYICQHCGFEFTEGGS